MAGNFLVNNIVQDIHQKKTTAAVNIHIMGDAGQVNKADSKLFQPLAIANGKIQLQHRVVMAPLTRNRGTPVNPNSTPENPNRAWYPNDLMAEYYSQRATEGGLIISEAIPPNLEVRTSRCVTSTENTTAHN